MLGERFGVYAFALFAEYCDERVCLSVCQFLHVYVFGTTRPIFAKLFMHVTSGRGSFRFYGRRHIFT